MSSDMTVYMVAGLAFFCVVGIGFVFAGDGGKEATAKKAKQIVAKEPIKAKQNDPMAARRRQTQDMLKQLRETESERRKSVVPQSLQARLEQAGLSVSPTVFWMISVFAGLGLAAFIFIGAPSSLETSPLGTLAKPILAAAAGLVGFLGLPRWVLGFITASRHKKFTNQFADALDIIVRGVKSGLPLNECLRIIARESPEPLRSEFALATDGLAMGQSIEQSLNKMYRRVPLPEVNFFNIVMGIQAKSGGNLSEALGNLSTVIRTRKLLREKISALSSEAKASAMIIGCLPPAVMVLVYVTTPDYILLLFQEPVGHLILLAGAVLMGSGIFIMRRMINFDF